MHAAEHDRAQMQGPPRQAPGQFNHHVGRNEVPPCLNQYLDTDSNPVFSGHRLGPSKGARGIDRPARASTSRGRKIGRFGARQHCLSQGNAVFRPAVRGFPDAQPRQFGQPVAALRHPRRQAPEPVSGEFLSGWGRRQDVKLGSQPAVRGGGKAVPGHGCSDGGDPRTGVPAGRGEHTQEFLVVHLGNEAVIARRVDHRHHLLLEKPEVEYHPTLLPDIVQAHSAARSLDLVAVAVDVPAFGAMRHDAVPGVDTDAPRYQKAAHGIPTSLCACNPRRQRG